jgi:ankyrin repeat protein
MSLFDAITEDDDPDPLAPFLSDLEQRNGEGHTPLEHAFLKSAMVCAETLLDAGAKPAIAPAVFDQIHSHIDEGQYSPVGLAIYSKCPKTARCLLEAGAPPDDPGCGGMHPLHTAALKGMTETCQLLLDRGVPVDIPMGTNSLTALALAVQYDRLDTIRLLIARGANLGFKDQRGKSLKELTFNQKTKELLG